MKGAFVTGIKVGGIGHQAGLLPGDVITAIDGQTLSSTEAYSDATKNLEPPWSFDVWNAHTNRHNTLEWSGTSG